MKQEVGNTKVEIQHDPTTKSLEQKQWFFSQKWKKSGDINQHQMGGIFNRQLDSMEIEAANQGFDHQIMAINVGLSR